MRILRTPLAIFSLLALGAAPARAELDFKWGGVIQSDMRYRLLADPQTIAYPSQMQLLRNGFSRNENLIKTQLSVGIGAKVKAVADVDLYMYGFSDTPDIDSLTLHERLDPYRIEVNAAYIDIYKIAPGLDLRIGRQVVNWGTADQFNPTSNVNTLDFSDALMFGKALANNMIRADWNPVGDWVFTGVFVPIFRPAMLPRTAPIALLDPTRPLSVQDDAYFKAVYLLQHIYNVNRVDVTALQPAPSIENAQFAFRAAGRLGGQDMSVSWYHGRFGVPVPSATTFDFKNGVALVDVAFPREDVIGADIGGTIPKLGGMGYWVEGAVVIPQPVAFQLYEETQSGNRFDDRFHVNDKGVVVQDHILVKPDGTYGAPVTGVRPYVNTGTPYLKLTIGGDYSINEHIYLNVQYAHGFFDEFGTGLQYRSDPSSPDGWRKEQRIGDYIIAGADMKFVSDTLKIRLFGVLKVPSVDLFHGFTFDEWKATGVVYPQISYQVWDGTELAAGAFLFLGDHSTKFGDAAAGASEVFFKARFQY